MYPYPSDADFMGALSAAATSLIGGGSPDPKVLEQAAWIGVGYALSKSIALPAPSTHPNPHDVLKSELQAAGAPNWGQPGHPVLTQILQSLLPILLQLLGGLGKGGGIVGGAGS
jgi:hypothetical protein